MDTVQFVTRNNIDTAKWNSCIDDADNGLIYAYTFYLDALCDNWDGLVLNDYEAVMPLPWRKKWSVHYLYQPFLTAQLGLFGNNLNATILKTFLQAIPKRFRYWDMMLNMGNLFSLDDYPLYERVTYLLPLQKNYESLYSAYRENIKRNIKKAINYQCVVKKDFDVQVVIDLAGLQPTKSATDKDFDAFKNLYSLLHKKQQAITYGVFNAKEESLATCVFFFSHNKAYYILVGNHPNGRTLGASHLLIDAFIKDYAGKNLMLDFEGSDIRNLAFFYNSFGAEAKKYTAIKINRLPWYAKWLKS